MKKIEVKTYELNIEKPGLAQGDLHILFMSDLHETCREKDSLEFIMSAAKNMQPDLILLGGDMMVQRYKDTYRKAADLIVDLSEIAPVYYARGNHEKRVDSRGFVNYEKYLQKRGICFLNNRYVSLQCGDLAFNIYGYDLDTPYYKKIFPRPLPMADLFSKLGKPDQSCMNILLAHNPRFYRQYLYWGADLTLCGHYHGGVMRLGKNRGLVRPDFLLFPEYCYGHRERNKKHIITTAGAGEHTVYTRIHNPREIVELILHIGPETDHESKIDSVSN